jgi:hypothetical protein
MPTWLIVVNILVGVFSLVCQWKVYQKAGQPGWAAIIPIYNFYVLLKIVNKPWWWILLLLVPFVNIVIGIWTINLLSKSFGKNEWFTVGLIFLSVIFYAILAFGPAQYQKRRVQGSDSTVLDQGLT